MIKKLLIKSTINQLQQLSLPREYLDMDDIIYLILTKNNELEKHNLRMPMRMTNLRHQQEMWKKIC